MDCLKIIILLLIIFIIFTYLNSSGFFQKIQKPQIIEGMEEETIPGSIGTCYDSNDSLVGHFTKLDCINETGNSLNWLSISEKKSEIDLLSGTSPVDQGLLDSELSIETGDVVRVGETLYIYFGNDVETDEIKLLNDNNEIDDNVLNERIVLWKLYTGNENRTEYCVDGEWNLNEITTEEDCNSPNNWIKPTEGYSIPADDCENFPGNEQRECHLISEIQLPSCKEEEGGLHQSKNFYNIQYVKDTLFEDICQKKRPLDEEENEWRPLPASTNIETMRAAFATAVSLASDVVIDPVLGFLEQQTPTTQEQDLEVECQFEDPENKYLGNSNRNSIGGYHFPLDSTNTGHQGASNILELCNNDGGNMCRNETNGPLECTSNFSSNELNISVSCDQDTNTFLFSGCSANVCTLSEEFNEKYKFKEGETRPPNNEFRIYDVWDTINGQPKIECNPGYKENEDGINISCSQNGDVTLSGCEENVCTTGGENNGFLFKNAQTPTNISSFLQDNNYNSPIPQTRFENCEDSNGPCIRCDSASHFHLSSELTDKDELDLKFEESFNLMNSPSSLSEEEMSQLNQIAPKVTCDEDNGNFNFHNCHVNKCFNPSNPGYSYIYDNTGEKLSNDDKKFVQLNTDENSNYYQYIINNLNTNDQTISTSQLNNNIRCGLNYTKEGETDSSDESTKIIDGYECYNFYDYKSRNDPNIKNIPALEDGNGDVIDTDIVDRVKGLTGQVKNYFSINTQCNENYCQWPYYNHNDNDNYKNPRVRDEGINVQKVGCGENDQECRIQLGYKSTNIDENNDPSSRKTVKEWVNFDETQNQASITCDEQCSDEPEYANNEIDQMLSGIDDSLIQSGQPSTENIDSSYLQSVGRGGPFSISRCWNNIGNNPPSAICNGTNCYNEESDCLLNVSGCTQNTCKLNPNDSEDGTRLIVETSNGVYETVGGITNENINEEFNVDQIRNISCDYNYSKEKNSDTNYIGNISIQCPVNGGYFDITNKCVKTECEGEIVVDQIGLREKVYRQTNDGIRFNENIGSWSICPGKDYNESRDLTDVSSSSISNLFNQELSNLQCDEGTGDDYNLSRYTINGDNVICEVNSVNNPNEYNISSVGEATMTCNYEEIPSEDTEIEKPKYKLSGCQPQICKYPPSEGEGFQYVGSRRGSVDSPGVDSPEMIDHTYTDEIFTNESNFIDDSSYSDYVKNNQSENISQYGGSVQCDPRNYHGKVAGVCEQTNELYHQEEIPEFTFTGCSINQCVIPNGSAPEDSPGRRIYDDLSSEMKRQWDDVLSKYNLPQEVTNGEAFSVSEFKQGNGNLSENPIKNDLCSTNNQKRDTEDNNYIYCPSNPDGLTQIIYNDENQFGTFEGLVGEDSYCIQNQCSLPDEAVDIHNDFYDYRNSFTQISDTEDEYLNNVTPLEPKINGYLKGEINLSTISNISESISEFENDLTCAPGYHNTPGVPISVSCDGTSEHYSILGCSENYCSLPQNEENYIVSIDDVSLETLKENQGDKLTVSQLEGNIECQPWATTNESVNISCNNHNGEFIYSGCEVPETNQERSYLAGTTSYTYQGSDCSSMWPESRIILTGVDISNGIHEGSSIIQSETGPYSEDQINLKMHRFMDESKRACDIRNECIGFTVGREGPDGMFISEQHNSSSCNNLYQREAPVREISSMASKYNERNEGTGSHALIYNQIIENDQPIDVLNYKMVPRDSKIFFEKVIEEDDPANWREGRAREDIYGR